MIALWPLLRYARRAAEKPAHGAFGCELCSAVLADSHRHAVDVDDQRLLCVCPACAVLFAQPETATGHYRTVPDRILCDPDFCISDEAWAATEVPVRLAFLFRSSKQGRWIAIYPSAAGATECELSLAGWDEIVAQSRLAQKVAFDVEAILVYGARAGEPLASLLLPIDLCYALVGQVRQTWKGLGGGDALAGIADRFRDLCARARPLPEPANEP